MLKQLMLTRKIENLRALFADVESEAEKLAQRRADIQKREQELTAAVEEITENSTDEEKAAVEEATDAWTADEEALTKEEKENADKKADLQNQIDTLTRELDELNERAKPTPKPEKDERKEVIHMEKRFFGMSAEQRSAILGRDDVKAFLSTARNARSEQRSVTNAGLLIPDVLLPIIRQVASETSKMMKHVKVVNVPGTSRQNVMGNIPEAVWTEACGKLNELTLAFYNVELDGFKAGGFFAVCNPILEDADDVTLASEILTAIGKAIGLAVDKAILFGTGTKMPVGIFTRLAQTEAPDNYPSTARPWVDLHTKNMVTIPSAKTEKALYQELVKASAKTANKYSTGSRFWAMNEATYYNLVAEAISINANGAIVSGQNMQMPVIGGAVELLDFIPDNVIIGGYGESYLLAERAGTQLATSEHYKFVEDQTVFRGTARYDGKPVIPEAFVAIGLGAAPTATGVTFAADTANAGT